MASDPQALLQAVREKIADLRVSSVASVEDLKERQASEADTFRKALRGDAEKANAAAADLLRDFHAVEEALWIAKTRNDAIFSAYERADAEAKKQAEKVDRLERLCRVLQKERNAVAEKAEESRAAFREELDKISSQIEQSGDAAQAEREALVEKMEKVIAHTQSRETYFKRQTSRMEAERQLYEANIKKAEAEVEKSALEKEIARRENTMLASRAAELQKQVEIYQEKLGSIEGTFSRTEKAFETFRKDKDELHNMLAQESNQLKQALKDMSELAEKRGRENEALKKQITSLSGLCKALQKERDGSKASEEPSHVDEAADPSPPHEQECGCSDHCSGNSAATAAPEESKSASSS